MQIYNYPDSSNWKQIIQRPFMDTTLLEKSIRRIMEKVKYNGDNALKKYCK